ncbi:hypothetical protein J3L16_11465 [Alteromonas sp. 5E99-2]|uniref:hypothetical protein n=1 Tax=Alteromonas sp. 5E99-2 TaxID=2817683 RepID=UPI001A98BF65|nr:hypothetical protein [Alteromonas sp. 5E99-2]MBO1256300.1 hypothetical protein [Alteromonas sp. 5E99-2]
MSTLETYANKIGKALSDVSSLNVRTFSGDLNTIIENSDGNLSTEGLDNVLLTGTTNANLKLEALTVMRIDGDIDQFVTTDISKDMKAIHDDAVETGKATRTAIIDFVKSVV